MYHECHKKDPEICVRKRLHLKTKNIPSKVYLLRIIGKHSFGVITYVK